jgi:hypothetical protein
MLACSGAGEIIYLLNLMVSSIFHAAPKARRETDFVGGIFSSTLAHDTIVRAAAAVPASCHLYVAHPNRKNSPFLNVTHALNDHSKYIIQVFDHLH